MSAINASQPLKIGHLVAGADLSTHQFKLVKQHTDGTVILVAATTDTPIGVLQNKPKAGQPCTIVVLGVTEVIAGNTGIAPGTLLTVKADGATTTAGTHAIGRSLQTATNNQLFTALVNCSVPRATGT